MNREVREITSRGDWLGWRKGLITASRIAAVFGEHPFLDMERLAAEVGGQNSQITTSSMRHGRILEPAVLEALKEDHPDWKIERANTFHILPEHRLACTPDAWLDDDGLIQVKTVSSQEWEKWQGRPPLAYTLQTLTELLVTDRRRGVLAVMVRSSPFPVHEFDVPRHPEAEAKILAAVAKWWRAWDAGEIAAPAPSLAADLDDGSHVDLSGDNVLPALLEERAGLKSAHSAAGKRIEEIDAEIKEKIGPARTAWLPGWSLTFATQHRKETVIPAKDIRVLRVKALEDANVE